ncbi:MAG TPA: ATP-binding cassette domain-containing protein [Candidatus Omnitrophota bacterium]|nr:ATP-binding cassette domain-containing protein [Candidatus Omnitrophota bacterium]
MMLEMQDIKKYFVSGLVKAVDGVSLCVERGECLAIVGESGCGKTTLAKVFLGLLPADEGRILLDGKFLDARGRRKVQIVFQDPYASLDPLWTVRGILSEAFHARPGLGPQEQERQMRAVLAEVGLTEDMLVRRPHQLSGGQRQRVAIARALLTQPRVLVLDEPVSSLDVLVQKQIMDLLKKVRGDFALTCVFISHNLRVVRDFGDKIAVMREGRVLQTGSWAQVFGPNGHPYARQLHKAAFDYTL